MSVPKCSGEINMLAAAKIYAARGWRTLPLHWPKSGGCTCYKASCASIAKHPLTPRGCKDASADLDQIRRWWEHWPAANIGIATGPESGLCVVDIDGHDVELPDVIRDLPRTPIAHTARGRHIYLRYPGDAKVKNRTKIQGLPIDVRGDGGYVVAPPSVHASGTRYGWIVDPAHCDLATPTPDLLAWLFGAGAGSTDRRNARGAPPIPQIIPEGTGNTTLTSLAGSMRRRGLSESEILAALRAANSRCQPPLEDEELMQIARSVGSYPTGNALEDSVVALERLPIVLAAAPEDIYRDRELLPALAHLAESDPAEFAHSRAIIKQTRISLRDLEAALAPLRREIRRAREEADPAGSYRILYGGIMCGQALLSNWSGRIVEEIVLDDGIERSLTFALEGSLPDGTALPRIEISASDYQYMRWPIERWGARAVVMAGRDNAEHLRCALQMLSGPVPRRTVYTHIGWREIGGQWVYLQAGGAIGSDGAMAGVDVTLPDALARYVLPTPLNGDALVEAVRASLGLLDGLAPDRIMVPLFAGVYRAVLGDTDFALHLAGLTGVFKTEVAALAQQHYGAGMDSRHLPASWSSTCNALEGLAFTAKDALFVVDDFAPMGSTIDLQRMHREAERVLQAQGNRAGRQRMRADATLRPAKPPRGLIMSTGEDVPRGHSVQARILVPKVRAGDVDSGRLTACQRDAAAGLYALAMAGYLHWLAPQYVTVRGDLRAKVTALRDRAIGGAAHRRTPELVANLFVGIELFLDFAEAIGASDATAKALLVDRSWRALGGGGRCPRWSTAGGRSGRPVPAVVGCRSGQWPSSLRRPDRRGAPRCRRVGMARARDRRIHRLAMRVAATG